VAQDGFVPVRPGELGQEQLPAAPLVFAAYSVIWMALIVYVFLLWRRLTNVERELRDVSAKLQVRRP
jgi:CcmD family protein